MARIVAAATAADGSAEATRLVQHIAHVALATAVQIASAVLAADGAGEHTVTIVVAHEALVAIAFARDTAATVLAAADGPTDGHAHQPGGRVAGAADLNRTELVGHIRLNETGQRILGNSLSARKSQS